jgi:hypothetical protein
MSDPRTGVSAIQEVNMARRKSDSENKLPRTEASSEGGAAQPTGGAVLSEMPMGEMNAPAAERTMIAARPGIDTPMPGVTDDTTMPPSGQMDEGEPGVLTDMPGETSAAGGARAASAVAETEDAS